MSMPLGFCSIHFSQVSMLVQGVTLFSRFESPLFFFVFRKVFFGFGLGGGGNYFRNHFHAGVTLMTLPLRSMFLSSLKVTTLRFPQFSFSLASKSELVSL